MWVDEINTSHGQAGDIPGLFSCQEPPSTLPTPVDITGWITAVTELLRWLLEAAASHFWLAVKPCAIDVGKDSIKFVGGVSLRALLLMKGLENQNVRPIVFFYQPRAANQA